MTMYRFTFLLLLAATANCHTWIEQMTVVAPNGTYVGAPGYIRGNVKRDAPGFGDPVMVNLLPPDGGANTLSSSDLMCKSSQTSQTQTDGSPRLQAAPGAAVALRWQENGHVTLPQNQPGKPSNRGNVYAYATSDPKETDTLLGIHGQWNPEGTGGDKRGKLLSVSSYDDGRCYQVNGGAISTQRQKQFSHTASPLTGGDLWCQQNFALPADAPDGKPLTLYWVWSWDTQGPSAPKELGFGVPSDSTDPSLPNGKTEIYTSCADIDISSSAPGSDTYSPDKIIQDQDLNNAAIFDQMAKLGQTIIGQATTDQFDSGPSEGGATAPDSSSAAAPSQSSSSSAQPSSSSSPAPAGPAPTSPSASSSAQPTETSSLAASSTSSSVAPAVSAMNSPGGPAPVPADAPADVVTVTVTDYVPASTAAPAATSIVSAVSSPSDGAAIQVGNAKRSADANIVARLQHLGGNAKFAPLRAVYHH